LRSVGLLHAYLAIASDKWIQGIEPDLTETNRNPTV
jgi:hypothetical protein